MTLKPEISLMTLLKAGFAVEKPNRTRIMLHREMITIYRPNGDGGWRLAWSFQGDNDGLVEAIGYINYINESEKQI